ncbi:GNAT family N-acetyltransferase [Roseibium aggregatum]|uniref:GNAT family N-acetyltransferase n=1 Tax=Roseibium aggregatum TaxID=187304 RepID=A0A939EI80_9HYPH|nr:GNAT family N-acetyltransferase [Roseibium aggregatum]MBN9673681.1 GNAT family N-acetyltransferase [Roseibium aggregatum]
MHETLIDLNGYTDIPEGKVAFVVTFLEMLKAPDQPLSRPRPDLVLERWHEPDLEEYRALFRQVGGDWIWFGRLTLDDAGLAALLAEPTRESFRPIVDGKPVGILELDFANPAEPELAYFGLIPEAIGGGAGRWLMAQAVERVWSRPDTERFWVHTCTGDSPQAIGFYMSCGFKPYKRAIEVDDDPRLSGLYPKDKAPHVPVIEGPSE